MSFVQTPVEEIRIAHFLSNAEELRASIEAAGDEAARILSHADFARNTHVAGNVNSSPVSTSEGALKAADDLIKNCRFSEKDEEFHFFGEHFREALTAVRSV